MSLPKVDRDETVAMLGKKAGEFTHLLRSIPDPSPAAIGAWTIGETAAHTAHVMGMYPGLVAGTGEPLQDHLRMSDDWDRMLADDPERDLPELARRIEGDLREFMTVVTRGRWDDRVRWHGGIELPVYTTVCILIAEFTLHGYDIARAAERPWTIEPAVVRTIIDGYFPLLPAYLDPQAVAGLTASYELRIRGGSTVYARVADGRLEIGLEPVPVDCRISADPVEYLLVGYGRKGRWGRVVTGKIVSWGKKPWLGPRFGSMFVSV